MTSESLARRIWPKIKERRRITAAQVAAMENVGEVRAKQALHTLWERGYLKKKQGYYIPMGDKYHKQSPIVKFLRGNPSIPPKQLKNIFKMDVALAAKDPHQHLRISREHRDTIAYLEQKVHSGKPLEISDKHYFEVQDLYYDLAEATRGMIRNPTPKLGTAIRQQRQARARKAAVEHYAISKELNPVPKASDLIKEARRLWDAYFEKPTKKNLKVFGQHLEVMQRSAAKSVKKELSKAKRAFNLEWKSKFK